MNEIFPLERVAEAYERMLSGQARLRVVLTMSQLTHSPWLMVRFCSITKSRNR